jgi:hypothetical protein
VDSLKGVDRPAALIEEVGGKIGNPVRRKDGDPFE